MKTNVRRNEFLAACEEWMRGEKGQKGRGWRETSRFENYKIFALSCQTLPRVISLLLFVNYTSQRSLSNNIMWFVSSNRLQSNITSWIICKEAKRNQLLQRYMKEYEEGHE